MGFTYDFANGNTEIVYTPEEEVVPNRALVKKINNCVYLLNVKVREKGEVSFAYDIDCKTNYLAWESEASSAERREMELEIEDAMGCCSRIGIPSSCIVQEKRYMYVDDENKLINFICIPVGELEDQEELRASINKKKTKVDFEELKMPSLPDEIPEPTEDEIYDPFNSGERPKEKVNVLKQDIEEFGFDQLKKEESKPFSFEGEQNPENKPLYEEIGVGTAEQVVEDDLEENEDEAESNLEKWLKDERDRKLEPADPEEEDEEDGTILLSSKDEEEEEGTVLLIPRPNGKAYLENIKTGEKFYIRKNNTKIGKKREKQFTKKTAEKYRAEKPSECILTGMSGCHI